MIETLVELVDKNLPVHPVGGSRVTALLEVITQGIEGQHQCGQALLTVHDQPSLYAAGLNLARSQYH